MGNQVIIPATSGDYPKESIVRKALGISDEQQDYYNKFNRYYNIYPDIELSNLITYVFITRPDLNIIESRNTLNQYTVNDPYMRYMYQFHRTIVEALTAEFSNTHDFVPFLTDRALSMQLQDISIKNYVITQGFTGQQFQYAGNSIESTTGGTFDITFRDDNKLRLTKFFNTWIYYMDGVSRDVFRPKLDNIYKNIIDYASSAYFIACDPTGDEIIYFAKYTGIFPLNAPHSNYSHNIGGNPDNKISITFAFSNFQALNPYILADFNKNSRSYGSYAPHFDSFELRGRNLVGPPYIDSPDQFTYKLRWNKV